MEANKTDHQNVASKQSQARNMLQRAAMFYPAGTESQSLLSEVDVKK